MERCGLGLHKFVTLVTHTQYNPKSGLYLNTPHTHTTHTQNTNQPNTISISVAVAMLESTKSCIMESWSQRTQEGAKGPTNDSPNPPRTLCGTRNTAIVGATVYVFLSC